MPQYGILLIYERLRLLTEKNFINATAKMHRNNKAVLWKPVPTISFKKLGIEALSLENRTGNSKLKAS